MVFCSQLSLGMIGGSSGGASESIPIRSMTPLFLTLVSFLFFVWWDCEGFVVWLVLVGFVSCGHEFFRVLYEFDSFACVVSYGVFAAKRK